MKPVRWSRSGLRAATKPVRSLLVLGTLAITACHTPPQRPSEATQNAPQIVATRIDGRSSILGLDDFSPRFDWNARSSRRNASQQAYQLRVSEDGAQALTWDSGRVASAQQLSVAYAGNRLKAQTAYHWQVRVQDDQGNWSDWSTPAAFEMGLGSAPWPAQWIGGTPKAISQPLLRRAFSLDKPLLRARLYATARGVYAMQLNGKPVGDLHLAPGWTEYASHIDYQTYDVTSLLQSGNNMLGAMLAPGWYSGHVAMYAPFHYGKQPAFIARLRLDFADGSSQWINTDQQWQSHTGPYRDADLLMGEHYDARLLPPDWSSPDSSHRDWQPAQVLRETPVELSAQLAQPVRTSEVRETHKLDRQPTPGATLYDLGQNMVGVVRVQLSGHAGQTVKIRYGEMLNPDGSLYTANLRTAKATDYYTFASDGTVSYAPRFSYHGFRYVEISGAQAPADSDVQGEVWGSDLPVIGSLSTSNKMLNQLLSNIHWGQRDNFLSIPTDTPARDERMGWTGDINVFAPTASTFANTDAFLTDWLRDLRDSQRPNGDYASTAPDPGKIDGATGWSDAGVTVTHTLWQAYGDTQVIERNWPAMQRFMAHIEAMAGPSMKRVHGPYGDWLHLDDPTPPELLGTAYLAYDARLMAAMANAIGKPQDAARYADLAQKASAAFWQNNFQNQRSQTDSQTSYAIALGMQLVPADAVKPVADRLAERVHGRNDHLSTGFLGTPWLLDALVRGGHADLAYKLLLNTTYPSWGYEVKSGATTMWERWNSLSPEGKFGDVSMNSFNHYAYGAVADWMFRRIGGIAPAAPGYRVIRVAPLPGGGLTYAEMKLQSAYGEISTNWVINGGDNFSGHVDIPFNAQAHICLPAKSIDDVQVQGQPLSGFQGVSNVAATAQGVCFDAGSGHWEYSVQQAIIAAP